MIFLENRGSVLKPNHHLATEVHSAMPRCDVAFTRIFFPFLDLVLHEYPGSEAALQEWSLYLTMGWVSTS